MARGLRVSNIEKLVQYEQEHSTEDKIVSEYLKSEKIKAIPRLRAIMFLEQAPENQLAPLDDRQAILRKLLACLIKPFITTDWWEKTLTLVEQIAREVDCYTLRFDKSGRVVDVLERAMRKLTYDCTLSC